MNDRFDTLRSVADHLIPKAHGMPSAADVLDDLQLELVLTSRPDLADALHEALRPDLGDDAETRLAVLENQEAENHSALMTAIVGGYYMASEVREAMNYPGQVAATVNALDFPTYMEEGLIESVVERGPIWRDVKEDSTHNPWS